MSNDLQAQISTRIGNTVSEIGKVNAAVTQLHSSTEKNNQAHKRFQDSASNAFKNAHRHASTFNDKMREVGHAVGLLGGEIGHLGHSMSTLGRLSEQGGAGIGRIAAAATVAGVAFTAYSAVIDHHIEQVKEATEAEEDYRKAIMDVQSAVAKNAEGGLSHAEVARKLIGASGPQAMKDADAIADKNHIDLDDARKGVLKSYHIKDPAERKAAQEAAALFSQSGAGSFEEGIDSGVSNPQVRAALRGGNAHKAAELARNKAITGRFQGGDIGTLDDAIAGNSSDSLSIAKSKQIDDHNSTIRSQESQARGGGAQPQTKGEKAEAASPEAKILSDMDIKLQKQIDVHEKAAEKQGILLGILADVAAFLHMGKGSESTQAYQAMATKAKEAGNLADVLTPAMIRRQASTNHTTGRALPAKH